MLSSEAKFRPDLTLGFIHLFHTLVLDRVCDTFFVPKSYSAVEALCDGDCTDQ